MSLQALALALRTAVRTRVRNPPKPRTGESERCSLVDAPRSPPPPGLWLRQGLRLRVRKLRFRACQRSSVTTYHPARYSTRRGTSPGADTWRSRGCYLGSSHEGWRKSCAEGCEHIG